MAAPFAGALLAWALAILVSPVEWAAWFHHPARGELPETTKAGATLLRGVLVATGAALIVVPWLLARFARPAEDPRPSPEAAPWERWAVLGAVVLGVAALSTRVGESLWYDEIAVYLEFTRFGPGPILGNFTYSGNHVLNTLLTWASVEGLADAVSLEAAFRLPAAAFFLGSIVATWGLAREGAAGEGARTVGAVAAVLAAVAPVAVLSGAEARGYSMMIGFAAASTWTFLVARRTRRPDLWTLYALLAALGVWSHLVTVLVPVGHGGFLLIDAIRTRCTRTLIPGMLALALAALLSFTFLAPLVPDLLARRGEFAAAEGDEPRVFGPEGRHALLALGGAWSWWALPGLVMFGVGLSRAARGDRARVAAIASLLGLPLLVIAVLLAGSWMYARFTLFALPGVVMLIALGIDTALTRRRALGVIAGAAVVGAWAADLALRPPKQPLREAMAYVSARRDLSANVLVVGLVHRVIAVYAGDTPLAFTGPLGRDIDAALAATRPEWVILMYEPAVPEARRALLREAGFREEARFDGWLDWGAGDVVVLRHAKPSADRP